MTDTTHEPTRRGFPRSAIILVSLGGATVVALGMSNFRDILAPVLFTLVLGIVANPVRTWLEKRGVSHGVATTAVIVVVLALLAGFVAVLVIATGQFLTLLPQYTDEIQAGVADLSAWLTGLGFGADQVQVVIDGLNPANIVNWAEGLLGNVFGIGAALVIVLSMLIVMSADATYIPTVLKQLNGKRPNIVSAIGGYAVNVRRYMVVTTVLGVAQGTLNAIALMILQVPGALLWGLLAFICSFIPNIGYFIAIVPPIVFGFLVGGFPTVIIIIIVYGILNAIIQTIIQPRVLSTAVSLSQTLTFFSVLFWAAVLGPMGAILAVPLTLLARTILIDSSPDAWLWRPALGDIGETKVILKEEDAAAKAARKQEAAEKKTV
jgi:AI-2 transport protein TqsA